jgi:hypothetical protein
MENRDLINFITKIAMNDNLDGDTWNDIYSELSRLDIDIPEYIDYTDIWAYLAITYSVTWAGSNDLIIDEKDAKVFLQNWEQNK